VARRAGLTRGAVYHHFRDKSALLNAVVTESWVRCAAPAWQQLVAPHMPVADRLIAFLARFLELLADDELFRSLAIVTVTVAPHAPQTYATEKQVALSSWRDALRSVVTELGGPPASSVSPDGVVFGLISVLHGATVLAAVAPEQLAASSEAPSIAAAIVHGLLHQTSLAETS